MPKKIPAETLFRLVIVLREFLEFFWACHIPCWCIFNARKLIAISHDMSLLKYLPENLIELCYNNDLIIGDGKYNSVIEVLMMCLEIL